jgi:hypothetical protein
VTPAQTNAVRAALQILSWVDGQEETCAALESLLAPQSKAARSRALPEGWEPKTQDVPPGVSYTTELARFRNHAAASGRKCADWGAAWRNWLIKAVEFGNRSRPPGVPRTKGPVLNWSDE